MKGNQRIAAALCSKCRRNVVCASVKMLLELHNPHPAVCSFIGNRDESTSFAPLDSHLRHH
jgi:hypothetical protein